MSVTISINGTDKSSAIDWKSVNLTRALTSEIDTLSFLVVRANSSGYRPALLDTVEVQEDSEVIFGGQIVSIYDEVDGMVEYSHITCKDYSFDMDKKLVVKTYENMTVEDIIDDIATNFLPAGYTTTNVVCSVTIKYIQFNYEFPTKCLQQLAQITNYDWYVDESKNIFFFLKGSQASAYNLTDTSGNYIYKSLRLSSDVRNIRNSIIVRGGKYQGNQYTETITADGEQTTFIMAYQYANIAITVDSVAQTVGIDFIDNPASFDCLYNFNEKAIKFPTASKPTVGQIIEITGNPYIPVITKYKDVNSINTYGEFEYKIVDKSINSKDAAKDRARAEIASWANSIDEGSFETYQTGLKTGQKINIQSTIRSVDDDYIVSRITSKLHTPTSFKHSVTLVTSQTYGMVQFLQNLLMQKDKEIEISTDEVVDTVTLLTDTFSITDTVTALAPTTGPYKWEPSASSNSRWNFATWG